jgi:hypothetical protein
MSDLDTINCDTGILADLTAMSNTTGNPIPAYPVFFSTGGCGGSTAGAADGVNFPRYYFPINCSSATVPLFTDNCLRIIDNSDNHISKDFDSPISASELNVLPTSLSGGFEQGNIFSDPGSRLYSWYVPWGYQMIFFHDDIRTTTIKAAFANKTYLIVDQNQVVVDACKEFLTLASGNTFFSYGASQPGNDSNTPCPLVYCNCTNVEPVTCTDGSSQPSTGDCSQIQHYAPFFLVLKLGTGDFNDLILRSCVKNETINYGSSPTNTLHQVYYPQSPACDNYITLLCSISNSSNENPYEEMCSCFTQQATLDRTYGSLLNVPVCCFGTDPSGDVKKSCFENMNSYKTADMLQNCCSFAECETLITNNEAVTAPVNDTGKIYCAGSFIQFPVVPTPSVIPSTSSITSERVSTPMFVWIIFGVAIGMLLLFILLLLFL